MNKFLKIWVITLSDRASKGIYEDKSGELLKKLLNNFFENSMWDFEIKKFIISDDKIIFAKKLEDTKNQNINLLFTTGGTGISKKDITIDVIKTFLDKEINGIMEMIRFKYGQINPKAMLSRSVAGIMKNTQVYCLPGSQKAVEEYMNEIFKILEHSIFMQNDIDVH